MLQNNKTTSKLIFQLQKRPKFSTKPDGELHTASNIAITERNHKTVPKDTNAIHQHELKTQKQVQFVMRPPPSNTIFFKKKTHFHCSRLILQPNTPTFQQHQSKWTLHTLTHHRSTNISKNKTKSWRRRERQQQISNHTSRWRQVTTFYPAKPIKNHTN